MLDLSITSMMLMASPQTTICLELGPLFQSRDGTAHEQREGNIIDVHAGGIVDYRLLHHPESFVAVVQWERGNQKRW